MGAHRNSDRGRVDSEGRRIFVADAHRDGKRFIVRADEKLTAFVELKNGDCGYGKCGRDHLADTRTLGLRSLAGQLSSTPSFVFSVQIGRAHKANL